MIAGAGLLILASPLFFGIAILLLRRRQRRILAPAAPAPGPALASPATKVAFRLYALRGLLMVSGGLLWAGALGGLSPLVGSIGLLASLWGVFGFGNAVRVGWRLRRCPWRPLDGLLQSVPGIIGGSKLLLVPDPALSPADELLELVTSRWRWQKFTRCVDATVWVAGDTDRGCVVAMPGGADFAWARRPFWRGERERMRRVLLKQPVTRVDLRGVSPMPPRPARPAAAGFGRPTRRGWRRGGSG